MFSKKFYPPVILEATKFTEYTPSKEELILQNVNISNNNKNPVKVNHTTNNIENVPFKKFSKIITSSQIKLYHSYTSCQIDDFSGHVVYFEKCIPINNDKISNINFTITRLNTTKAENFGIENWNVTGLQSFGHFNSNNYNGFSIVPNEIKLSKMYLLLFWILRAQIF